MLLLFRSSHIQLSQEGVYTVFSVFIISVKGADTKRILCVGTDLRRRILGCDPSVLVANIKAIGNFLQGQLYTSVGQPKQ